MEAEKDSKNDDDLPPGSGSVDKEQGRPRGRRPLPAHLKRERIEHDLTEEEKHCASCHQDLRPIGEELSERYEYIPAQMLVIEDLCKKYACACSVKTATKPLQPIEKSTAGASLLAQVIVSKVADHVPVHRQAKILRRFGVEIADQTMCGWMRQSAELLDPLYARLKQFVLSSKVVGTDDTPVKVLDRSLVRTTRKGRFWPYLGDRTHGAAVFDYTPTRERAGPERFLKKLSRILASRCVCGLRQLLHQSCAGIGGGSMLGAHEKAFSPGARYRPDPHGRSACLYCEALRGGEMGAAVGR
jgi:transposase